MFKKIEIELNKVKSLEGSEFSDQTQDLSMVTGALQLTYIYCPKLELESLIALSRSEVPPLVAYWVVHVKEHSHCTGGLSDNTGYMLQ